MSRNKKRGSWLLAVILVTLGIAIPASASAFDAQAQQVAGALPAEASAQSVPKQSAGARPAKLPLTTAALATANLSEDGTAYAVLTADGELIFFRSTTVYEPGASQTVTDINGTEYTGEVFTGIEAERESNANTVPWKPYKDSIRSVACATGQKIKPANMSYWFQGCENAESMDVSGFDTSQATALDYLFNGCNKLTSLDISNFQLSDTATWQWMLSNTNDLTEIKIGDGLKTAGGLNSAMGNAHSLYYNVSDINDFVHVWRLQGSDQAPLSPRQFFCFYDSAKTPGTWKRENISDITAATLDQMPVTRVKAGTLMPRNPLYISDGFDLFSKQEGINVMQPIEVVSALETDGTPATVRRIDPEADPSFVLPGKMQVHEYCNTGLMIAWEKSRGYEPVSATVRYPCIGTFDGKPISATLTVDALSTGTSDSDSNRLYLCDLLYGGGYSYLRNVKVSLSFNYINEDGSDGDRVDVSGSGLAYLSQNGGRPRGAPVTFAGSQVPSESLLLPPETTQDVWLLDRGNMDARATMIEVPIATPDINTYVETYATSNNFVDRLTHPMMKEFNHNSTYYRSSDPAAFHYMIGLSAAGWGSYESQHNTWLGIARRNKTTMSGWFAFSSQILTAVIPDDPVKEVDKTAAKRGEKVTYTVRQPIPSDANMQETYTSLVFTDTLPDELEYNNDLVVLDEDGKDVTGTAGTVSASGNTVTYTFSEEYLESADDTGMIYKGGDMTFVLSGTVRAKMAGHDAVNQAFLTFNDSDVNGKKKTNTVTTHIDPHMSDLRIAKKVAGDAADSSKDFSFQVRFLNADGADLDGEFAYEGSREGTVKSGGTVRLKAGDSITVKDLPEDTEWQVKEVAEEAHGYEIEPVRGQVTGPDAEKGVIKKDVVELLEYTNVKNTDMGAAAISKTVAGEGADQAQLFEFTVRIGDAPSTAVDESADVEFAYTGSSSGVIANGGTIQLKHGDRVVIEGLPHDTPFEVAETLAADYESAATGATGTVAAGQTSEAAFVNTYSPKGDDPLDEPVDEPDDGDDPVDEPDEGNDPEPEDEDDPDDGGGGEPEGGDKPTDSSTNDTPKTNTPTSTSTQTTPAKATKSSTPSTGDSLPLIPLALLAAAAATATIATARRQ